MFASDFLGQSATIVGLIAGCVAIGGFLGNVRPSMFGAVDSELRRATTVGGLIGLGMAIGLIVLSVSVNFLS
jgi:hypothetical protein